MAILERVLVVLVFFSSFLLVRSSCPSGWTRPPRGSECFLVEKHVAWNYKAARDRCEGHDSHLALPTSSQDWKWLGAVLEEADPRKTGQAGFWLGLDNLRGRWRAWNNSLVDPDDVPWWEDDQESKSMAAYMVNGGVQQISTHSYKWIVCQRPHDAPMYCDADDNWQYFSGSCYKIADTYSWSDAQEVCEEWNAHLPVVHTSLENEFLLHRTWADLREDLWIGLRRQASDNVWRWSNGENSSAYPQFWRKTETLWEMPMDSSQEPQCAYIDRKQSGWQVEYCEMNFHVICQRKAGSCPSGWARYGDVCYEMEEVPLTKSLAASYCTRVYNASLLTIKSELQFRMLGPFLQEKQDMFGANALWLGLTVFQNGTLRWDDGDDVSFENLVAGQTKYLTKDVYCLTVGNDRTKGLDEGEWYVAEDCQDITPFVCQMPVSTTPWLAPLPSTNPLTCPQGWQLFGQQCYLVVEEYLTWLQARDACSHHDAHLATVNGPESQYAVSSLANKHDIDMWIGLQDFEEAEVFRWDATGERLGKFSYWFLPRYLPKDKNCVEVMGRSPPRWTGLWHQRSCTHERHAVCQKPARACRDKLEGMCPMFAQVNTCSSPWPLKNCLVSCDRCHVLWTSNDHSDSPLEIEGESDVPLESSQRCGHGWEERPGSSNCYMISDLQRTWYDAADYCNHYDGDLASATSAEEQDFLAEKAKDLQGDAVWLSGWKRIDSGWSWLGEPFFFINWKRGDTTLAGEDCIAMASRNGSKWFSEKCQVRNSFVCKKKAADAENATVSYTTSTPAPARRNVSCEEGWFGFENTCFLHERTDVTWFQARDACRERGAELATILDKAENDLVWSTLPAGACLDQLPTCLQRAHQGECWRNASEMERYCPRACRKCHRACWDRRRILCPIFAAFDGCQNAWARDNCPWSCRRCIGSEDNFWIGLSAGQDGRTFSWESGTEVTYTRWRGGQPAFVPASAADNVTGCVSTSVMNGRWTPQECRKTLPGFVCSKPMHVQDGPVQSPLQDGCPQGAVAHVNLCYLVEKEPRVWSEAETDCQSRGRTGHLAAVTDRWQQAFLSAELGPLLKNGGWLGLKRERGGDMFTWTSGHPFSFDNWYNAPQALLDAGCVVMEENGLWNVTDCLTPKPYVCQLLREGYEDSASTPQAVSTTTSSLTPPTSNSATPTPNLATPNVSVASNATTTPLTCGKKWVKFDDQCYAVARARLTWDQAEEYCRSLSSTLVNLYSKEQFAFLRRTLARFGFQYTRFWVGATRKAYKWFIWSNGQPMTYFPHNFRQERDLGCWVMASAETGLRGTKCHHHYHPFCSRPLALQPYVTNSTSDVHLTQLPVSSSTTVSPATSTSTTTTTTDASKTPSTTTTTVPTLTTKEVTTTTTTTTDTLSSAATATTSKPTSTTTASPSDALTSDAASTTTATVSHPTTTTLQATSTSASISEGASHTTSSSEPLAPSKTQSHLVESQSSAYNGLAVMVGGAVGGVLLLLLVTGALVAALIVSKRQQQRATAVAKKFTANVQADGTGGGGAFPVDTLYDDAQLSGMDYVELAFHENANSADYNDPYAVYSSR